MSDVTIKYNNNTIGELNDAGTAVLQTANKKCVSDIEVEYIKPSGGGVDAIRIDLVNNTGASISLSEIHSENLFIIDDAYATDYVIPTDGLTVYSICGFDHDMYFFYIDISAYDYDVSTSDNVSCEKDDGFWMISYEGATNLAGQTVTVTISGLPLGEERTIPIQKGNNFVSNLPESITGRVNEYVTIEHISTAGYFSGVFVVYDDQSMSTGWPFTQSGPFDDVTVRFRIPDTSVVSDTGHITMYGAR